MTVKRRKPPKGARRPKPKARPKVKARARKKTGRGPSGKGKESKIRKLIRFFTRRK